MDDLRIGDLVEFDGDDSYFKGRVVSLFCKLPLSDGRRVPMRCVVQDDRGLLLIKDPKRARKL